MDFLKNILSAKQSEVAHARRRVPFEEVKEQAASAEKPRDFRLALSEEFAVIAEIKKASPSRGILVADFDHRRLATEYAEGGARALSVLTDGRFFQGDGRFVREVKQVTLLPVLRKDFIIDEYQVYESRAMGADALLLIVRILNEDAFRNLYDTTRMLGMTPLVEVHDQQDIDRANRLQAEVVGINNRNLSDFSVSLETSLMLRPKLRRGTISVSESGIQSQHDVKALREAGFHAVLVGEGVAAKADRVAALRELLRK